MATAKEPKFPHPTLEVGVPNYPTPNVPDFYKKDGHILLVDKISADKGSYNPQPLDGSVVYNGRDAKKFPDQLYLVAERPTEDGLFVLRFWANDRTLASQDPWNYGIEYSSNNPDYPVTSREYIVPRDQYEPATLGSIDPIFLGTQVIAQQKMVELPDDNPLRSRYVSVQRVYESIPGPQIAGINASAEFGPATITSQVVAAGSSVSVDYQTIKAEVSPVDSVKSTLQRAEYQSVNTLTGYQYDEFFESNLTITKQLIDVTTGALGYSDGILSYKDDPVNYYQKQRTIVRTSSLPPTRVEYKTAGYSTPQLIFGLNVSNASLSSSDYRVAITPRTRAAQSRLTMQRITTSFQYGSPSAPDPKQILSPELKRVSFTGYNINFDLGDALCDELTSIEGQALVNVNDLMLAGFIAGNQQLYIYESLHIPATTITATEYDTKLNTWQITSFEQEYWKAGIWVSRKVETYII
jgi:hypothetical protein